MGNICATPMPSITIIIHSKDFEEEVCKPKGNIEDKPVDPNFIQVEQAY
jgi:hypothetical protein